MLGWFPKRNSHIFLGQISRTSRSNAGPLPKTSRIDCLEVLVRASGYMSLSGRKANLLSVRDRPFLRRPYEHHFATPISNRPLSFEQTKPGRPESESGIARPVWVVKRLEIQTPGPVLEWMPSRKYRLAGPESA